MSVSAPVRAVLLDAAEDAIRSQLLGRRLHPGAFGAEGDRSALAALAPDDRRAVERDGASFVTLLDDHRLLGCIGSLEPYRPLIDDVAANAIAAAFHDPRLPALTPDEFVAMTVKVSVLSPVEPLPASSWDELRQRVRPGTDGLLVTAGRHRGTFLPSVWEQLPLVEDFLDHLWRKAGLAPRVWPGGITVGRYVTTEFGRSGPRSLH